MSLPLAPLRVLSWNILEGWHRPGNDAERPTWDTPRRDAARALVALANPDVVVLNEALWCRPHQGYFVDYAKELGFAHAFCDTYDGAWGNVILSHRPFQSTRRFRIHNRGGLLVEVDAGGWTLGVATYHPHPSRYPHNKASDYRKLLPAGFAHPLVLCGDFNAISPEDNTDRAALVDAFCSFSENPEASVARFIDGGQEVFATLRAMGMHDAMRPQWRQPTMPTELISSDKSSAMRIDHAWVNDAAEVIHGQVVSGALAEMASDHYPLLLDVLPKGQ